MYLKAKTKEFIPNNISVLEKKYTVNLEKISETKTLISIKLNGTTEQYYVENSKLTEEKIYNSVQFFNLLKNWFIENGIKDVVIKESDNEIPVERPIRLTICAFEVATNPIIRQLADTLQTAGMPFEKKDDYIIVSLEEIYPEHRPILESNIHVLIEK